MKIFYTKYLSEFHDKYATFYNESESKLSAFGELSAIQQGVKKVWDFRKGMVSEYSKTTIDLFLLRYARRYKDEYSIPLNEALYKVDKDNREKLEKLFDIVFNDVYGIRNEEKHIKILSAFEGITPIEEKDDFWFPLKQTFEYMEQMQQITPNLHGLTIVMNSILDKGYPDKIESMKSKSKEEQQQIINESFGSVGRPPNPKVPQSDIENFVRINLFPNGEKTDSKKFIHPSGKYKDLPNWNQLALKYLDENPEVELNNLLTDRQLKTRLKMAYEVINTSMN